MFTNAREFEIRNAVFVDVQGDQIINNINAEGGLAKFKKWLAAPDPSTNHNSARKKYHKDTGLWILADERYIAWKKQAGSFLWINGIYTSLVGIHPLYYSGGYSRSASSTIIEDIKTIVQAHPGTGLAFFYFDSNDNTKQTVKSLLSSLVLSLTAKLEKFLLLDNLYTKYNRLYSPPESDVQDVLLELLGNFNQAYLVIDALDECIEYDQLFEMIQTVHDWQLPHCHLLVSSRREQSILMTLQECGPVDISLSPELVGSDITSYIHAVVGKEYKFKRWGTAVQDHIKNTLIVDANGMFRWVACQIDQLKFCPSQKAVMDSLKSLPKTLEGTYDQILQRIHEGEIEYTKILLSWLVFGMCPLTFEELALVVTFDASTRAFDSSMGLSQPDDILQLCSSLVTRGDNNIVALAHASVKEYFLAKPRFWHSEQIILSNISAGNALIAHCCLVCIQQNEWYDEQSAGFPLMEYSTQFWPVHYKLSRDPSLDDIVLTFFEDYSDNFGLWIMMNKEVRQHSIEFKEASPFFFAGLLGLDNIIQKLDAPAPVLDKTMHIAAEYKHIDIVKYLLSKGADANAKTRQTGNVLHAASVIGNTEVVQLLLDMGADVNANDGFDSPLHAASEKGHLETVRVLLDRGANVNATSGTYGHALQGATANGYIEVAKLLLERGANANAQGGQANNALQAASSAGHAKIVKLLLDNGADVDIAGGYFGHSLQAAIIPHHTEIVKILLDKGANPNASGGRTYSTPLQAASKEGYLDIVRLLVSKGVDIQISRLPNMGALCLLHQAMAICLLSTHY
ncbi:hypothetical protein APHAL10511_000265 [Amanita phalloides]|nr:hypothetical protein APHAL10511_000265 [Amanita phalloides]